MAKISILIALLLQLCTMVPGLDPCSEYYTYVTKSGTNEILGQIEIPSPPKNGQFHLKVGFNTNSLHMIQPVARLELARSKEESTKAIQQGGPLLYHVHYVTGQPIPKLTKIWFNDRQYCPNPEQVESIITTVELSHMTEEESTPRFDTPVINNNSDECGISSIGDNAPNNVTQRLANPLVAIGRPTSPGKWPWLVALFILRTDHEFACGGTLLTHKHVITAAHCLKLSQSSNETVHPNVLVVALGRYILREWRESGTENRDVASFTIHPDFAHALSGDSDLAILVLRTPVEYTDFIKPICLWTGSTNIENVVGKTGIIVGWGKDENNQFTVDPRLAWAPIVRQDVCLWSHRDFYDLSSPRTFCAGLRDDSGPCNGDSGSGLVLLDEETNRYHLRGIVSRSVVGNKLSCDLKQYIVYVDVAKYLPWIKKQITK